MEEPANNKAMKVMSSVPLTNGDRWFVMGEFS